MPEENNQTSDSTAKSKIAKNQLLFVNHAAQLSDAQAEFNRLMKRLEKERAKEAKEAVRLEALQKDILAHVFPLIEECHRHNRDICGQVHSALKRIKFSKRQHSLLQDLLCCKVRESLADPTGLSEEDCEKLAAILQEHTPASAQEDAEQAARDEIADLLDWIEGVAAANGIELDLSDIDMTSDPEEISRQLADRLHDLEQKLRHDPSAGRTPRQRKPTKAQQEKERKRLAQEEAKQKDLKSLYKQLAKAIHPDLEKDPEMKLQKESWMKRLTTAHAAGDLSELLRIEMEWLGEESENLAKASEEKLKIYHAVLKEQISEIKRRTERLVYEPQFQILARFVDSFFGVLPTLPSLLRHWMEERHKYRSLLAEFQQNDTYLRHILKDWANAHDRAVKDLDCPF